MHKILDTTAKQALWSYLLPVLETENEEYAHKFFNKKKIDVYKETSNTKIGTLNSDDGSRINKASSMNTLKFDETDTSEYEDIGRINRHRRALSRTSNRPECSPGF